jgi:hypothetical protein
MATNNHSITVKVSKREAWWVDPLTALVARLPKRLKQRLVKSRTFQKLVTKTEIKHFN